MWHVLAEFGNPSGRSGVPSDYFEGVIEKFDPGSPHSATQVHTHTEREREREREREMREREREREQHARG